MATFADTVRASLHGRRLLRVAEERRLTRLGVEGYGLDMGEARIAVGQAAASEGVALQSSVDDATATWLEAQARQGTVGSADVTGAVSLYRGRAGAGIGQEESEGRVKSIVLSRGLTPRREGWFWRDTSWFNRLPDDPVQTTPANPASPTNAAVAQGADAVDPMGPVPTIRILDAWATAFNAGDVEGVVRLYAPDALLLATASPHPLQGRDAIRPYFVNLLSKPQANVEFSGPPLVGSGRDPVTVGGLYVFSWIQPDGSRLVIPARYSYVLTRATASVTSEVEGAIMQHHSSALPGDGSAPL